MNGQTDDRQKGLYNMELIVLGIAAALIIWLSTSVGMAATLMASLVAVAGFLYNSRPRPKAESPND